MVLQLSVNNFIPLYYLLAIYRTLSSVSSIYRCDLQTSRNILLHP